MSLLQDIAKAVFGQEEDDAIPVMDGVMTPNALLDEAEPIGSHLEGAEDFYIGDDGSVVAAAGRDIVTFALAKPDRRKVVASFTGDVGALMPLPDGRIVAGVSGQGLFAVKGGKSELLHSASTCPTALSMTGTGKIVVANGSAEHSIADWAYDLMRHGRSGSLMAVDPDTGEGELLLERLRWPAGVAQGADGGILFTESWAHSLSVFSTNSPARPKSLQSNLIGYPARITPCSDGGYLLSVFALRTQLVELVLREDDFRNEMIETIDPAYWIVPAYATDGDYREPLQGGSIKKLGIQKPWAPPRAYGLVIKLDAKGEKQASYHSRVGGKWHGISCAHEHDGSIYALSKGRGQLLKLGEGAEA